MKLSDVRAAYDLFSSKASELGRQLSFAGIAVVWVFRIESPSGLAIPPALVKPALFFCAALAFDLFQYVVATVCWGTFHRYRENRLSKPGDDPVLQAPRWINWPQMTFFILKLMSVAVGYVMILMFLVRSTGSTCSSP